MISCAGTPPSRTHTSAVASSAPLRTMCCAQFSRAPGNQRVCGMGSAVRTWVHGVEKSTSKYSTTASQNRSRSSTDQAQKASWSGNGRPSRSSSQFRKARSPEFSMRAADGVQSGSMEET